MKKNLLLRLCLMMALVLTLYSCIHEEIISSSDPSSTEYTNKSLWKEDEKYIKNVMKVYSENEEKIKKSNGTPLWDYAMTMDHFDESFLIVPVAEGKKIVSVLSVPKIEGKVYFGYSNHTEYVDFFQKYIDAPIKKALTAEEAGHTASKYNCTTKQVSMWYPNSESDPDGGGEWGTTSITTCTPTKDLTGCYKNVFGDCITEGGDDGYPYPGEGGGSNENPEEPETPCKNIKNKIADTRFKNQYNALNTDENFDKDHEVGFFEKASQINNSTIQTFTPISGVSCTTNIKLPAIKTGITGLGHTHNKYNCKGRENILAPSPEDISIFLYTMVKQAGNIYGDFSQAYYLTVTAGGSYMLQYTGTTHPNNLTFNVEKLIDEYERAYEILKRKDNSMSQNNVEKVFAKFLKEKVNIEGLEVYKVTNNSSEKLEYDSTTGILTKVPCPIN